MAKDTENKRPAHVWAWLLGIGVVLAWLAPVALAALWWLGLLAVYALVCWRLPTYDCPRCAGRDTSHGWLSGLLRAIFGGNRFGCGSRRCHGGQRTRLGVEWFQPDRAAWLAQNPGTPERVRLGR